MVINMSIGKIEWVCWSLIVTSGGMLIYGAESLPEAIYDPLGPAGFPKILGVIIVSLSAFQLAAILLNRSNRHDQKVGQPQSGWLKVVVSIMAVLLYVTSLAQSWASFSISTVVFLATMGFAMTSFTFSRLPFVLANAVAMGLIVSYLFTDVLLVAMPG
ncbi:MAG: hypothetical protein CME78_11235 [Halomonas sp.]|nr:hypothetical protein [Halomonas sp.]